MIIYRHLSRKNDYIKSINQRILQVRKFLELTQEEFSSQIGISRGFLSGIEKKRTKPSIETLIGIVKNFKINERWLLTGEGTIQKKEGVNLEDIPRPYCSFVNNLSQAPTIKREDFISIPLVEGSIAAGQPILSEDKIEGWAVIHVSQVGRRQNLVAIRIDERDGKSMEPYLQAGSMVAIDRDDREIQKGKIYAVRTEWGCTIKFIERLGDFLVLRPGNRYHDVQIIDLRSLNYDPIVGRVIWNWQTL